MKRKVVLYQQRGEIMNYFNQIKGIVSRNETQEAITNTLEAAISAVLGDPISAIKIIVSLAKSPFFIREQLFWVKMETFLNGVYLSEDDCAKLRAKLTEDGEKEDNAFRLVESIDRAETQRKVHYLINVTHCLLTDFIDRITYFRICHAITHTLEEDLIFLGEHIDEENIPYSSYTQGLLTAGLMYQSVLDSDGEQKYSFTPLARVVDQYAVNYENVARYPNPSISKFERSTPKVSISGIEAQLVDMKELKESLSKI